MEASGRVSRYLDDVSCTARQCALAHASSGCSSGVAVFEIWQATEGIKVHQHIYGAAFAFKVDWPSASCESMTRYFT